MDLEQKITITEKIISEKKVEPQDNEEKVYLEKVKQLRKYYFKDNNQVKLVKE